MTPSIRFRLQRQHGFTLIEMAIVLLIAGLLVAGITQMMGSAQKNRGDQSVANEVRAVTSAAERMLVDQQSLLSTNSGLTSGSGTGKLLSQISGFTCPAPTANPCNGAQFLQTYLPANLDVSSASSAYTIGIARNDVNGRPSFRALILRQPDSPMDDGRLSRVASLIGTQGGLISNAATAPFTATGAMGSWQTIPSTNYGITALANGGAVAGGMIAALTNTVDAQVSVNTLSRIAAGGQGNWSESNTMRGDLYMGSGSATNDGGASDAYAIHNASGVGYVLTDATVSQPCSSSTVHLYDANNTPLQNSSGVQETLTVENYMSVVGLDSSGNHILLQCVPVSGTFTWEPVGSVSNNTFVPTCQTNAGGKVCYFQFGPPGGGGLMMEWGILNGFSRGAYVAFPYPFPHECITVTGHFHTNGSFEGKYQGTDCNQNTFMLDIQNLDGNSQSNAWADWFAIGD